MGLIDIKDVTFKYDNSYEYVFEHVSFQIDTNWKLGFIGRNGRGKTTFLKLLMKEYEYSGSIHANTKFQYFPFFIKDKSIFTIYVIEDIFPEYEYWRLQKELNILQVDEDVLYRPFDTLSNGEQTKVLLATLFLKDNTYLLIDEPTNHLDEEARKLVSKYLKSKKGFILVSHDRAFMDGCVDHVLAMNKTNIEIQSGNFSTWYINKQNQDHLEEATNEKLKKDIKRLKEATKRTSMWSNKVESTKNGTRNSGLRPDKGYIGHKAAKMMQRSKNIEKRQQEAITSKSTLLKNIEEYEDLKIQTLRFHSDVLVSLSKVSIFYGNKQVCRDISFTILQGERIALSGKNGCGKSSILKLIAGDEMTYTGDIYKSKQLIISKVDQDTSHLQGNLKDYAYLQGIDESLFKTILRKLDFSRTQFAKNIETYSGGQKKKVLIATALAKPAHLYIFDEPLNYIDIFSRMQIEKMILQSNATILFVEHDHVFKDRIASRIMDM